MKNIISNLVLFLKKHTFLDLNIGTIFAIITALAIIPCFLFLPDSYGYENSIIENFQLVILILSAYYAITVNNKNFKKFYYFVFLVLIILMIREVNCGRTIFFAIPGEVNEFYRWSEIKYGWLAHPLFGMYITFVGIYFIYNKLYTDLWKIVKEYKFPIISIMLTVLGIITGIFGEEILHNAVFEELSELLFYIGLANIIFVYTHKYENIIKDKSL